MATFCQAGDIARVTFPDGSVRDFPGTPINVSVTEETGNGNQRGALYIKYARDPSQFFVAHFNTYSVVYTVFLAFSNYNSAGTHADFSIRALGHTLSTGGYSPTPVERSYGGGRTINIPATISSETPVDWYLLINNVIYPRRYRIKILNASGAEIFNQLFDSNNYSVECVQGCPPNTLDCGDCCLDCNNIFNQISGIRALLSRIN